MAGDYATGLEKLVRGKQSGMEARDAFDTSILDPLDGTLGGVEFRA